MPAEIEDIVAARREIWSLLQKQLEALNSPSGLTDGELIACYDRQTKVQQLREKLEATRDPGSDDRPMQIEMPMETTFAPQAA
jgi:hypothetical protein